MPGNLVMGMMLLPLIDSRAVLAQERLLLHPENGDPATVEFFIARPGEAVRRPSFSSYTDTRAVPGREAASSSPLTDGPSWRPSTKDV